MKRKEKTRRGAGLRFLYSLSFKDWLPILSSTTPLAPPVSRVALPPATVAVEISRPLTLYIHTHSPLVRPLMRRVPPLVDTVRSDSDTSSMAVAPPISMMWEIVQLTGEGVNLRFILFLFLIKLKRCKVITNPKTPNCFAIFKRSYRSPAAIGSHGSPFFRAGQRGSRPRGIQNSYCILYKLYHYRLPRKMQQSA